jgi:hypothetical protein
MKDGEKREKDKVSKRQSGVTKRKKERNERKKETFKLKSFMMLQTAACRWCQCAVSLRHTQLRSGQASHVSKRDICAFFRLTSYEPTVRGL